MKKNKVIPRTEKHIIKSSSPFYRMLVDFCHASKNLYNHANYIVRNEFINNSKWTRYGELDKNWNSFLRVLRIGLSIRTSISEDPKCRNI